MYAVAFSGEKASCVIKTLKSAMLVMRVPCAIQTVNGPAYISQQLNEFLSSWRISRAFGIPYNPQGHAIVERTHWTHKEILAKSALPKAKQGPHLALTEALFHLNFLIFDESELSPAYKHWAYHSVPHCCLQEDGGTPMATSGSNVDLWGEDMLCLCFPTELSNTYMGPYPRCTAGHWGTPMGWGTCSSTVLPG